MKDKLREAWLRKRQSIPDSKRQQAAKAIYDTLLPFLSDAALVLSYSSIRDELSTQFLNKKLARKERLALPRIVGEELWVYRVFDPAVQLVPMSFGIEEPNPDLCRRIEPKELSHVIVPAIAFDSENHRLGYGKGYFDRFLDEHKTHLTTIGIGFIESYSEAPFPTHPHDVPLDQIILV